jgi:hypothetical protein
MEMHPDIRERYDRLCADYQRRGIITPGIRSIIYTLACVEVEEEMVVVLVAQEQVLKVFLVEQQHQVHGEVRQAEVELHQQVVQGEEMEHRVESLAVQAELESHLQLLELHYFTQVAVEVLQKDLEALELEALALVEEDTQILIHSWQFLEQ